MLKWYSVTRVTARLRALASTTGAREPEPAPAAAPPRRRPAKGPDAYRHLERARGAAPVHARPAAATSEAAMPAGPGEAAEAPQATVIEADTTEAASKEVERLRMAGAI